MRPDAFCMCGLKLLVHEAFSFQCMLSPTRSTCAALVRLPCERCAKTTKKKRLCARRTSSPSCKQFTCCDSTTVPNTLSRAAARRLSQNAFYCVKQHILPSKRSIFFSWQIIKKKRACCTPFLEHILLRKTTNCTEQATSVCGLDLL